MKPRPSESLSTPFLPVLPAPTTALSPQRAYTRLARESDVPGILECLRSAFGPYRSEYTVRAYRDTTLTQASAYRRLMDMAVWVVVGRDGTILATLSWARESSRTAHLRGMAVDPSWQGTGIAQQLLDRVVAEIEGEGIEEITLDTTLPLRRAARFYERNGFRRSGRVRDYFGIPLIEYRREVRYPPGKDSSRSFPGARTRSLSRVRRAARVRYGSRAR